MGLTEKIGVRDIGISIVVVLVFVVGMLLALNSYQNEGEKRSATISEEGEKNPHHIEAFVKLLTIDPVKGDITARLEFIPHGEFANEDGTLTRNIKFYINSANGKLEHVFEKGKRMNPMDTVVSMYDGLATDYPLDQHSAALELYFTTKAEKAKAPESKNAANTPVEGNSSEAPQPAPGDAAKQPAEEEEVPLAVDFFGSIAGYKIAAAKSKDSDESYVVIDMSVKRSSTVLFFSGFVMLLMWGMTLAVMGMVLSIVLRGRKIELAMFSFIAALLFAFAALRNSQPGVPPIGTFSDFVSFFWAEVILSLSLLTIIVTWLLRPAAK